MIGDFYFGEQWLVSGGSAEQWLVSGGSAEQ